MDSETCVRSRWTAGLGLLERGNTILLGLFTVIYSMVVLRLAAEKPLWYDELFTLYLTRFTSINQLWENLKAGVDLNPPLVIVLGHLSIACFGESPVAVRLPSVIAFGTACVLLQLYVARRTNALLGWTAVLLLLGSRVFPYAYEARAYAVVFCLGMCALLCRAPMIDGPQRNLFTALFVLALTAAVCSHWYAVLLLVPFGLGELVRMIERRRMDLRMCAALLLPLTPILLMQPLLAAAKEYSSTFWAKPSWGTSVYAYEGLLSEFWLPLGLIVVFFALEPRRYTPSAAPTQSRDEIAVIVGLFLIPFVGALLAKVGTGAFTMRYVLSGFVGLIIGLMILIHRHVPRPTPMLVGLCLLLMGWGLQRQMSAYRKVQHLADEHERVATFLETKQPREPLPIVVGHSQEFLELKHTASPATAERLTYVTSIPAAVKHRKPDTNERALQALQEKLLPLNVTPLEEFRKQGRPFFVLTDGRDWLMNELEDDGARFVLQERTGEMKLYRVDWATR